MEGVAHVRRAESIIRILTSSEFPVGCNSGTLRPEALYHAAMALSLRSGQKVNTELLTNLSGAPRQEGLVLLDSGFDDGRSRSSIRRGRRRSIRIPDWSSRKSRRHTGASWRHGCTCRCEDRKQRMGSSRQPLLQVCTSKGALGVGADGTSDRMILGPLRQLSMSGRLWEAGLIDERWRSSICALSDRGGRMCGLYGHGTVVNSSIATLSFGTIRQASLQTSIGYEEPILGEGPSCVFVGPLETAEKGRLEELYQQARDSYYSGEPLIVDDMFDKVEVRLRWYGSKLVLKYPRCSLKRLSVYADAEADDSQMWALASIWIMLLIGGLVTAVGPPACAINKICKDAVLLHFSRHFAPFPFESLTALNGIIGTAIGLAVGIPISTASLGALNGLWRGDLVALKGSCPSCGEEVYAFVRADSSSHPRHKSECHVCEHPLVFHAKVERSGSSLGRPWAYGRVYLVTRPKDLAPP